MMGVKVNGNGMGREGSASTTEGACFCHGPTTAATTAVPSTRACLHVPLECNLG
jgi:hypothetical protein